MRRLLVAAGAVLGTLFVATAGAYAGFGLGRQVKGSWHPSPRLAAHLAASQDVTAASNQHPLSVQVLLVPQTLSAVLRQGVGVQVTSNQAANGTAYVTITRAAAKQTGVTVGKGTSVVIGQGTVSQVKDGTVTLRMKLSPAIVRKLQHLQHLALTLQLRLVAAAGQHLWLGVIGRY